MFWNVVIRSCNDEERTLHGETWEKCKTMKSEKRASRSAKSQLCRCELFTELLLGGGAGGGLGGGWMLLSFTARNVWRWLWTERSGSPPHSVVVVVGQKNYRNMRLCANWQPRSCYWGCFPHASVGWKVHTSEDRLAAGHALVNHLDITVPPGICNIMITAIHGKSNNRWPSRTILHSPRLNIGVMRDQSLV